MIGPIHKKQQETEGKVDKLAGRFTAIETSTSKFIDESREAQAESRQAQAESRQAQAEARKAQALATKAMESLIQHADPEQPGAAKKPRRSSQRSFQAPGQAAMPQVENRSTLKWDEVSPEIWKWLKDHLGLLVVPTQEHTDNAENVEGARLSRPSRPSRLRKLK